MNLADIENAVREAWAEELKTRRPGPDSNFFLAGGNSLAAVRMMNRLSAVLGTGVPLQALFQHPTPTGLAGVIAAGQLPPSGPDLLSESTLMHRLSMGPDEAGVGVIVLASTAGLISLRNWVQNLQGVTTLIAVLPPNPTDRRTDDARETVEQLAKSLRSAPVHTIVGLSVAGYLAASLAKARETQQVRPPKLVLLEPPTPDDLMSRSLSELLLMPEVVLKRFTSSLHVDSLATAPRGTAEFRQQIVDVLMTHRIELASALRSVDPAILAAPPAPALDIYLEWASWLSLCMQLVTVTYGGPVVCVEGLSTAKLEAPARAQRFARIRGSFPQVRFQETTSSHTNSDLLSETILQPHFTTSL